MKKYASLLAVISIVFITPHSKVQGQIYNGNSNVGIICVQFKDYEKNPDAEGGHRRLAGYLEKHYRVRDYYDIMFQESYHVTHPDSSDVDSSYSFSNAGWAQLGSFRRYVKDNSYNTCDVTPYILHDTLGQDGILNQITLDSLTPGFRNGWVQWVTVNFNKPQSSSDPTELCVLAQAAAKIIDSLQNPYVGQDTVLNKIKWWELDAVRVVYAGNSTYGYAYGACEIVIDSFRVNAFVTAELFNDCFRYPLEMIHEGMHAVYDAHDMYDSEGMAAGHYSIMGGKSPMSAYTPPMMDPWHRLQFGWLDYRLCDTLIDAYNYSLPIVEKAPYQSKPEVLVIPAEDGFTAPEWNEPKWDDPAYRYLIVENRRFCEWDANLVYNEDKRDKTYYLSKEETSGGFLIWSKGVLKNIPEIMVVEADVDYGVFRFAPDGTPDSLIVFGRASDLFDGKDGRDAYSLWTIPGLVDHFEPSNNILERFRRRNILLEFSEYDAVADSNMIRRLSVGKLAVERQGYNSLNSEFDVGAFKYNTQNKSVTVDTVQYILTNSDSLLVVNISKDNGTTWREAVILNEMTGYGIDRRLNHLDNGAISTSYNKTTGENEVWCVWEEQDSAVVGGCKIKRMRVDYSLSMSKADTTYYYNRSTSKPCVASSGEESAYAYAAYDQSDTSKCGIMLSMRGTSDWPKTPQHLAGTDRSSINPSIAFVHRVTSGGGSPATMLAICYYDMDTKSINIYINDPTTPDVIGIRGVYKDEQVIDAMDSILVVNYVTREQNDYGSGFEVYNVNNTSKYYATPILYYPKDRTDGYEIHVR